jgi:hypothetical protein
MILTEQGLRFAKHGDHWRCVEHPDLVMLCGERYRVREREYGSLDEMQDELRRIKDRARLLAVAQEVAEASRPNPLGSSKLFT